MQKKTMLILLLIVVSGFAWRFYLCCDPFLHPWDERFHALVAKHMIKDPLQPVLYGQALVNPGNTDWRYSHTWLHKPPLPLWAISASLRLFGSGEFFVRLPSLLLSTLSILLTFYMGRRLFNTYTGLWACFFQSVNGFVIEITSGRIATDHVDLFFMVFIQLSIFFALKFHEKNSYRFLLLCGLLLGLALLCKWLPAFIVLPLLFILNYKKAGNARSLLYCLIVLIVSLAVWAPYQFYAMRHFPAEFANEHHHMTDHFFKVLDGQTGGYFHYLSKIRINYHDLIYLPLAWLAWKGWQHRDPKKLFLLAWILIPLVFFSLCRTKMQGYILFIAPALFITLSAFLTMALRKLHRQRLAKHALLFLFLLFPAIYFADRVFIKKYSETGQEIATLKQQAGFLSNSKVVVFNCKNYIEAMYYFGCTAYNFLPGDEDIARLKRQHYTVCYFKDGDYKQLNLY